MLVRPRPATTFRLTSRLVVMVTSFADAKETTLALTEGSRHGKS
jgi:hypothetical protein